MAELTNARLGSALPERFDFYHLGPVALRAEPAEAGALATGTLEDLLSGCATVGFRLFGDLQGLILVAFEKDLDASTYTELGNVIASQLSTQLNRREGIDVMISPPQALTAERVQRLLPALRSAETLVSTYLHRSPGHAEAPVHVLISRQKTAMENLENA